MAQFDDEIYAEQTSEQQQLEKLLVQIQLDKLALRIELNYAQAEIKQLKQEIELLKDQDNGEES